jgi:hypothetical protein
VLKSNPFFGGDNARRIWNYVFHPSANASVDPLRQIHYQIDILKGSDLKWIDSTTVVELATLNPLSCCLLIGASFASEKAAVLQPVPACIR